MKTLSIDLETFSSNDLQKCGVYKYAEAPDFEILLFGYSADGGPVEVVDLACGEEIPQEVIDALTDDAVTKWAYNCQFERVCLSRYLSDRGVSLDPFHDHHELSTEMARFLNPESWRCSMIWSAYMGLPRSLESVGAVLGLEEQKLKEGKDLIRYFCVPCKPTKANGGRTRNLPAHDPDKWEMFKKYNKRDVETEMAIQKRLTNYPVPDFVWDEFHIDQEINDRGIMLDMDVVTHAIDFDERSKSELAEAMQELTDLDNPNSVVQMKQWLSENGMEVDSLGKKEVAAMLKTAPPKLAEVLTLRQQLAKSSVKKYQAMQNSVCADNRCRGMFAFYGANRTGRFAGRIVQLQNLPQNHIPDLAQARSLVKCGDYEALELLYENVPEVLSELIRTAFVPKPGYKFIVSDFSAIEARVLSWLAGEQWRMQTFAEGGDIYCATAERMFHCKVVKHGENGELRQKGNPYKWKNTSVQKILSRQEYCGDVINFKTYSKSFKKKDRLENPPENWVVFKGVHEPIIDRETFNKVQEMLGNTKHRAPKPENGGKNMFCDLLRCADCGKKLWYHTNPVNKDIHFFSCSNYAKDYRGSCQSRHYIRADAVEEVVKLELGRMAALLRFDEDSLAELLAQKTNAELLEEKKLAEATLQKSISRMETVAHLYEKVYEDNATGKVTDEWFMQLSHKYEVERMELKEKIAQLREKLNTMEQQSHKKDAFLAAVRKFMEMGTLTAPLLQELIDHIDVYETEGTGKNRTQRIVIYYRFVGYIELPDSAFTRDDRYRADTRQGVAVEYIPKLA